MQRTERVLKVATVQNGLITGEYLLRDNKKFTIGSGYNVDVHVNAELPRKLTLFFRKGPRYGFVIVPGARGRVVSVEGRSYTLDQLVNSEYSRIEKGAPVVYLDRIERGKITVGDTTFLFKYIELPPPPKLDLPAPKKDWRYLGILLISLLLHSLFMYYLGTKKIPSKPETITAIPTRFAKLIVKKPIEKPKPRKMKNIPMTKTPKVATQTKKAPAETQKAEKGGGKSTRVAHAARPSRAAIVKKVRSVGVLAILTSKGGAGGVADVLKAGVSATGDLDQVLSEVGGVSVANNSAQVLAAAKRKRGAVGAGAADIGELAVGPGESIGLGKKKVVKVRSRILTGAFSSTGSLDSRVIGRVVKMGMGGIKYCYEMGLKRNPKLSGKVVVEFVIGTSGRVTSARVTFSSMGDSDVESCIVRRILRFRFPPPKNGSVRVSYPFIFTSAG